MAGKLFWRFTAHHGWNYFLRLYILSPSYSAFGLFLSEIAASASESTRSACSEGSTVAYVADLSQHNSTIELNVSFEGPSDVLELWTHHYVPETLHHTPRASWVTKNQISSTSGNGKMTRHLCWGGSCYKRRTRRHRRPRNWYMRGTNHHRRTGSWFERRTRRRCWTPSWYTRGRCSEKCQVGRQSEDFAIIIEPTEEEQRNDPVIFLKSTDYIFLKFWTRYSQKALSICSSVGLFVHKARVKKY